MDIGSGAIIVLLMIIILSSGIHTPEKNQVETPQTALPSSEVYAVQARIEKFILNYAPKVSREDAALITQSVLENGQEFKVEAKLITALIALESRFNKACVSSSGAKGLGQLMPSTAQGLKVEDPFDIRQNVRGTVRYFRSMLNNWAGDPNQIQLALASYKEGPNALKRSGGQISADAQEYIRVILSIYQKI
jgi:soluble lytic murein transglycosylase-like protein